MTHGSLFSGIGGFDLAAEWMGWHNLFHCEWNPFGQKVLKYYWPNAESFEDITKTNFTKYANKIDIISGGFPCQPYSSAGKRKGKEDPRHLWPEMLRTIKEISPRFVVGENVRGLTNWNGGLVFDEVCVEMENLGYQVAPVIIPASACNAPHQRERIWFVAHSISAMQGTNQYRSIQQTTGKDNGKRPQGIYNATRSNGNPGNVTNTYDNGCNNSDCQYEIETNKRRKYAQRNTNKICKYAIHTKSRRLATQEKNKELEGNRFIQSNFRNTWTLFPTQSAVCGGDDGLPTKLDGITFSKWRNESLKAYGNAIVPNVAYEIFKVIQKIDDEKILLGL